MADLYTIQTGDGFFLDFTTDPGKEHASLAPGNSPAGGAAAASNAPGTEASPIVFRPLSALPSSTSCYRLFRVLAAAEYPAGWSTSFAGTTPPVPYYVQMVAGGAYLVFNGSALTLGPAEKATIFLNRDDWAAAYNVSAKNPASQAGEDSRSATQDYVRGLPEGTMIALSFSANNSQGATIATFAHNVTLVSKPPCPTGTCQDAPAVNYHFDIAPMLFFAGFSAGQTPIYLSPRPTTKKGGVTVDNAQGCTANWTSNWLWPCKAGGLFASTQYSTTPRVKPSWAKTKMRQPSPLYIPSNNQLLFLKRAERASCTLPPVTHGGGPPKPSAQDAAKTQVAKYKSYITYGSIGAGALLFIVLVGLAVSAFHTHSLLERAKARSRFHKRNRGGPQSAQR